MVGSFLLHSEDLGETEEILSANFAAIRIDARTAGHSTSASVWRRSVGPFVVDEAEFGYDMSFDMDPPDHVLLCRVRGGVLEDWQRHTRETFKPGKAVAMGALDGVPCSGAVRHAHYDLIAIDRQLLGDVAGDQSVRLTSSAPVNDDANRLLVDAIDYVRHGVLANPHTGEGGLLAGALSRYLAAAMLSALPHATAPVRGAGRRRENSIARFRQAIAFIDDHAQTDISSSDIATAADTTPGSLRHMFRRYHDCTPMEYVRRVRMNHAHHDLDAGLGGTATVTEIAQRWGFGNVDRFAADYRKAYGRIPEVVDRSAVKASPHE